MRPFHKQCRSSSGLNPFVLKMFFPQNNPRIFTLSRRKDVENQRIVSGTLEELGQQSSKNFGEGPLYSLVIVSKKPSMRRMHMWCVRKHGEASLKKDYGYILD